MTVEHDGIIGPDGELILTRDDFRLESLDDELRVDELCRNLLRHCYDRLLEDGLTPDKATFLASGADYFVRDFVVGYKHRNLLDERPGIVRQFAGNWYIVNTLEPDIAELAGHLEGVGAFYRFLRSGGFITARFLREIEQECADREYYARRIDSFWEIRGDGYFAWERECTLKEP